MKRLFGVFAALVGASMALAATAHGNDRSLRGVMVTPASCQPYVNADRAHFFGNAWTVDEVASTTLSCPLSLNNIELGGSSSDNDITKFRVHYQMPNLYNEMYVNLIKSEVVNGKFVSSVVCGGGVPLTTYFPAEFTFSCVHDVAANGVFYNFGIVLKSTYPGRAPSFFGIDFP